MPKVRESTAAKTSSENARKMTQDKTRIPNHRDMASTRAHCTPNACTPKPRNIYRSSPVSKCSGGMSNGVPLVDHSRNSSFFLDSKQFVCSICHKYIFNTNHDDCITKILNKVNSRAKVQSLKIRNNNPIEPKNHTHKPGRQIGIGQRFSLNKSSAVHEKPHTPRSCLRWKPTALEITPSRLLCLNLNPVWKWLSRFLIMSNKRSSDSSKKLKGIQTLTPAEQEAANIMKDLKESKKMSKRQPELEAQMKETVNIFDMRYNAGDDKRKLRLDPE
ncbi:hypothetical protein Tco_0064206 [Tanacetum coccineum]